MRSEDEVRAKRRLEGRWLALSCLASILLATPANAQDRAIVQATAPSDIAVTVYRDPNRQVGQQLNRRFPRGFAMISETRSVTLPPGESRIRFEGVAEGMIAVSAIVTGLPGGTIEKNRNADLLSPAALVDGTLGNRVTITRTNPGTGEATSEDAIVRTRADGGIVLETESGYEAVRCSGLPERLTFDRVPDGLSAQPIYSIDTRSTAGGTYEVTLSYLSWGFDWEANYVATIDEEGRADDLAFDLTSWLTILNDNGQGFPDAELMAVAGRLNVVSDFRRLASPPVARALRLNCYPLGSTAAGSPIPVFDDEMESRAIVVTGSRVSADNYESAMPMPAPPPPPPPPPPPAVAGQEDLGDLKLYRVPFPVDVNAKGLKQVAFLREEGIASELAYEANCTPWQWNETDARPAIMILETENDEDSGLGVPLPTGSVAVFERGPRGELLVGETNVRDYAVGQDVDLPVGLSAQVFVQCTSPDGRGPRSDAERPLRMRATLTNANPHRVTVRLQLGSPREWRFEEAGDRLRDGQRVIDVRVPANGTREVSWTVLPATT